MSDLDTLRENIIQAAREFRSGEAPADDLYDALDAYDAALKPDVWQLLEDVRDWNEALKTSEWMDLQDRVEAALLWRKENPDA